MTEKALQPLSRGSGTGAANTAGLALDVEEQQRAAETEKQLARRRRFVQRLQGEGLVVVLIAVVVAMWASSPSFLTASNLLTAASVVSILGIMAIVETAIVIAGEIDISIGSNMAITSVVIGLLVGAGMDVWLAAVIGLLLSGAVGAINGVITVYGKVNSLVTTLGSYSIFLGLAYGISNTNTVSVAGQGFNVLGGGAVASIPAPVIIFVVLWLIGAYVMRHTAIGRHVYATGDNYDAAVRAGVRADRLRVGLFIAMGLSAGLAGIVVTSELGAAAPQIGDPYLLAVVTAVIMGGASMRGGRGSMIGTLVAVAILGVLQNGFALLQFSTFLEDTVLGVLLILAVLTDQIVRRTERAQ